MIKRMDRLIKTMIAKKIVAWIVATVLLVHHYINGQEWVLLTAAIFTLDLATKMKAPGAANESA